MSRKTGKDGVIWNDRKRTFLGLPLSFTKYALTEERLFVEKGFLSSTEDEVRLYRIMDISLTRTLLQKLVGVGTIKCCSADKTLGDFEIKSIKHSKDVKEMLSEAVEKQRDLKRVSSKEFLHDDGGFDHDDNDDDYSN